MAVIYQNRDINLLLNGNSIFCSDLSLSQSASISPVYDIYNPVSFDSRSNSPVNNSLSISYYFSGKDFLRDYIYSDSDFPITGYLAGLVFNQGYLESYTLNISPQSFIKVNASIKICDELSGDLNKIVPRTQPTGVTQCTSNHVTFGLNSNYSAFSIENIRDFNWSYQANIEPIYFQRETGESHLNPDRVVISDKEISCTISTNSNNNNLLLPFTGDNYAIDILIKHPTNSNIYETYSVSGKVNKKEFNISQNLIGESSYSISQWHLNEEPKINNIDLTTQPNTGYILIHSPNSLNGYFSSNRRIPLVEKVILGGEELKFTLNRGASNDTITGYTTSNTVNGDLQIQTTKGTIFYPSGLTLNFSGIGVSGFKPQTGKYHDLILISGTNFHKITHVLFDSTPSNFQIKQNTGIGGFHELIAAVPENARAGKITVLSSLKDRSGISTGTFYPLPIITGFTPTGIFSGLYYVGGYNFSGITNVYFNNVNASSFGVVNQNLITGLLPGTGRGYTKGYVKVSGFQGISSLSNTIYQPIVPIYGLSALSGTFSEDLIIRTIVDTSFLCPVDFGYKVGFGRATGVFVPSGTGFLTGLIPSDYFNKDYISIYEPDGVGKYPPFTGRFTQVGPEPDIDKIYPEEIYQYSYNTLNLEGQYFKDFFGLNTYLLISGQTTAPENNHDRYVYPLNVLSFNQLQTKVIATGIRITGATGYYDVNLINYVGTGTITGLKILSGRNLARLGGKATLSTTDGSEEGKYGASKAIDTDNPISDSFARSRSFGEDTSRSSAYFDLDFETRLITISKIQFYQYSKTYSTTDNGFINGSSSSNFDVSFSRPAISGIMVLYAHGTLPNLPVIYSGQVNWNNNTLNYISNPFTGVRYMRLYREHPNTSNNGNRHLMWNTIKIY